ncbi:hypothetical protein [Streptomyces sp. NPDC003480]
MPALEIVCQSVAARSSARWAPAPAVVAIVGAVGVPLLYLTVTGKEQTEVGVVERAADLLFASGSPYHPSPRVVRDFNPYPWMPNAPDRSPAGAFALFSGEPRLICGIRPVSATAGAGAAAAPRPSA